MTPDVRLSALHRDGFCLRVRAGVGVSCYALTRVNALMCPLVVAEGGVPKPPGCVVTSHARRRRIPPCPGIVSRGHPRRTGHHDDRRAQCQVNVAALAVHSAGDSAMCVNALSAARAVSFGARSYQQQSVPCGRRGVNAEPIRTTLLRQAQIPFFGQLFKLFGLLGDPVRVSLFIRNARECSGLLNQPPDVVPNNRDAIFKFRKGKRRRTRA